MIRSINIYDVMIKDDDIQKAELAWGDGGCTQRKHKAHLES